MRRLNGKFCPDRSYGKLVYSACLTGGNLPKSVIQAKLEPMGASVIPGNTPERLA
jgi:hypothetical protein